MMRRLSFLLGLALAGSSLVGCERESAGWHAPDRDFTQFTSQVFPVLLRDCGFPTCHGSSERFFRVWGPGRVRWNPMTRELDGATGPEAANSYQFAISMVDPDNPSRSLLLRKPLAVEAGGSGHRGADKFGRNVYRTVNDDGYVAIARWVFNLPPAPPPAAPATQ